MKIYTCIFFFCLIGPALSAQAQKENALIRKGNRLYKQKQFDQSQAEYQKAIQQAPTNPSANYNLGNTQFRKNNFDDAVKSYDATVDNSTDQSLKEKGLYNKGVALIKQQKLDESIEAWKNSLRLDPADSDARENLEKALLEKKKQSSSQDKKDQKQQQKQNQNQQQQPKQQQSKLNKQQVEQLLKALTQKEKEVQEKMNQNNQKSLSQPDKDW